MIFGVSQPLNTKNEFMKFKYCPFLIFLILFLQNHRSFSQYIALINIDSLYHERGVIFSNEYVLALEIEKLERRFTPDIQSIAKAENLFLNNYNLANQSNPAGANIKFIESPKNYFRCFVRQYVGYYDKNGDINILIHLIDNSRPKKTRKVLGDKWKENFVIFFAQPMPLKIMTYNVNLTQRKVSLF